MATKYPFEKHTRVTWAPSITNIALPNAVELNAGTLLTCHLTKDGLNPGGSTNGIDSGALCSNIEGQIAGSVAFSANLKFFRYEQGDDDAWDLVNWGDAGYLVIRRGLAYDTIWGVGQAVEVYKAQFGEPVVASSAANTLTTFEVSLFVEDAEQKATVGASS